jgi:hypothetical protein
MKNILITVLFTILALTTTQANDTKSIEACKTSINEAKSFQATMKSDKLSEKTFAFNKENVVAHCGSIASKKPYKVESFAKGLYKKDTVSVNNCKTAITMAKSYDERVNKTPFIANAHKVNVIHNCGILVAKKTAEYSFFDVADNGKEDRKGRCIASIKEAHGTTNAETRSEHKSEVIANCGRLQSAI